MKTASNLNHMAEASGTIPAQPALALAYETLTTVEQTVLQLCGVIAEPAGGSVILDCLARSVVPADAEPPCNAANLAAALRNLQQLGFLTETLECHEAFIETANRKALKDGRYESMAMAVRDRLPVSDLAGREDRGIIYKRCLRDIRINIYTHDVDSLNRNLLVLYDYRQSPTIWHPVGQICNNPFDADWFRTLPYQIQFYALHEIIKNAHLTLEGIDSQLAFLREPKVIEGIPKEGRPSFYYLLIAHLLLQGEVAAARSIMEKAGKIIDSFGLSGWFETVLGNHQAAIHHFEEDLDKLRAINANPAAYFTGMEGLFYILALLKTGDFGRLNTIRTIIDDLASIQPHNIFGDAYGLLRLVVQAQENMLNGKQLRARLQRLRLKDSIATLFAALAQYWIDGRLTRKVAAELTALFDRARENGYRWLALEYAELLAHADPKSTFQDYATKVKHETGLISIISTIRHEEPWQRALKALFHSSADGQRKERFQSRLAWLVQYSETDASLSVSPRIQKYTKKGLWSKGRPISLKRLHERTDLDFLSEQDKAICADIIRTNSSQSGPSYAFDRDKLLPTLVDHPFLFLAENPAMPVEFIRGEPEIRVDEITGRLHIEFFPDLLNERVMVLKGSPTCFKIIEITDEHRRVAGIIGEKGLEIPAQAKDEALTAISAISSFMPVHSALSAVPENIEAINADPKIHIHLLPYGSGFKLTMLVKPFPAGGPYQKPGRGPQTLIVEAEGRRRRVNRDLHLEETNAEKVVAACPNLSLLEENNLEWILLEPENCLELLTELQSLPTDVTIEWPEGEKLTVGKPASLGQLQVSIRKKQNWFDISGLLTLDDSLVLDMRKLLELVKTSPSRFISLGEGHFLALTQELYKRLDEINSFTEQQGKTLRIHPAAAHTLENVIHSGIRLDADQAWQMQLQRINSARALQPRLPSTLQAGLRDYQAEGYMWLARLAHWGVGACLADDMGLGKTIQALAIILDLAPKGPSLVVAPTSVCQNWEAEADRFAPTLNVTFLGPRARKKQIGALKSFDLLVVSYGLLQQESEILASVEWQAIVLDEAQAIKNFATKRSRAAMALNGKFRLLTTGTPIENHLGELWTLFQFINPGLLGSLRRFNKRFAIPIERQQDREAKRKLKKLIQPFILRRIKSQVLEELPPRTEITLQVEMNRKEAALYEALRLQALENLDQSDSPPGQKHLQILAEIMKLRRACCNPRLVLPETSIPSSKLELFGTVVDELLENRHKALVFSQFVDHLSIIREFLDKKGIVYQYLDGGTPPRRRKEQIETFQSGKGDLFLISLKAGGVGLNLTAADYVIHMDPWWNPAVEDQASDRAHRIGQQHPVTIYRLVTLSTIEEKIIKLHQDKRDLADSLLDGSDVSGKMSTDALLKLIQQQ